ncbi:MAG: DUF3124 domain-containing protein [Deltaproteobacteria bacterium]|nr:DUF3124 domain-containing protein [Deltaproteobacteria bacterium]
MRRSLKFLPFVFCFLSSLFFGINTTGAASEMFMSKGEAIYVPVYSHIYSGDREHPFYLTATLSVRNTDPKHAITILSVDYYDSKGKLLKPYLENPVILKPLATNRYIIKESDKSGGSGANFIVKWKSSVKVNAPIVESIMISTKTQQGISFISRGRVIQE